MSYNRFKIYIHPKAKHPLPEYLSKKLHLILNHVTLHIMTIQEVNKENERPVTALENNIHAFKSPSSSPMTSPKKRQQTRSLSKALQLHEPKKYRREKPLCHNPASHSIYRHCKLLIGRDGVHDPNSFVQVSFNDENGLMDIEVNKCPVTIEKSDDQTFGKLIIKTLKAAEDLHHEAYRQHITKDLNPYCSGGM